jgi:murein DD-endopeptidase MepM/ murein hydrolase activator NlpD
VLGETYAYDFVRLGPGSRGRRFYRPSLLHYLVFGVRLQDCFGWGQPIFSSKAGLVVQAEDGWPERNPVHPARDLAIQLKHAWTFDVEGTADLRPLSGNYVIVETSVGYAVYAHAQTGSIKVAPGDRVAPGQPLGNVGHSGNSTAPHLHFHLMDHQDPRKARGIPCCFRDYEVFREDAWHPVRNGIPRDTDRIRKL